MIGKLFEAPNECGKWCDLIWQLHGLPLTHFHSCRLGLCCFGWPGLAEHPWTVPSYSLQQQTGSPCFWQSIRGAIGCARGLHLRHEHRQKAYLLAALVLLKHMHAEQMRPAICRSAVDLTYMKPEI
jgi:hypothetical protein